jgi:BirA family biotin operon repressor/biotin-[acetyl-CoA-carboxylase] ligase
MDLPRSHDLAGSLRILERVGSTNDVLSELATAGAEPHLSTVVTLDQTGGRGRLGRAWTAPVGKSLAASVLVRPVAATGFPLERELVGWLPLVAGVAMATAVDSLVGDGRTTLKWPNDVQIDGRKVCGVLAELLPAGDAVVIGTGVNLTLNEDELPVPTAISLAMAGVRERGDELVDLVLSRYLGELAELLGRLGGGEDARGSGIQQLVSDWCSTLGQRVRVQLPGGADLIGIATGIDETGRLLVLVDASGQVTAVAAGDVTHLRYE